MISSRRRLVFGTITLCGAVALTLFALEIYLRATSTTIAASGDSGFVGLPASNADLIEHFTDRGKRLNPNAGVNIRNHYLSHRDIFLKTNSYGFRGPDFPTEKPADETRVLVLGDSITMGGYLPEEEVFVSVGERILRDAMPDRKFRLINAGVGGADIQDEVNLLEDSGIGVHPDIVAVVFYLNDGMPPWNVVRELSGRGWLRRHSVLAERLYAEIVVRMRTAVIQGDISGWTDNDELDWVHKRDDFIRLTELARRDWGAAWEPNSWERVDRQLRRLKQMSELHGFSVMVMSVPVSFQVFAEFVEDSPQQTLRRKCGELGFAYHDALPAARQQREPGFFFDHCHPTEHGNEVYGRELAKFLAPALADRGPDSK